VAYGHFAIICPRPPRCESAWRISRDDVDLSDRCGGGHRGRIAGYPHARKIFWWIRQAIEAAILLAILGGIGYGLCKVGHWFVIRAEIHDFSDLARVVDNIAGLIVVLAIPLGLVAAAVIGIVHIEER
jgi:hypothetical protein